MDPQAAVPPEPPAAVPPPAPRLQPFPARIGMVLAEPQRALQGIDVHGGGVRDAGWLVLIGVVCFRLEDVTRAVLAITHVSLKTVVLQALAVLSFEVREAVVLVIPAALLITLAAGRGRRDPSRDVELGAACYVPYFAGRGIYRALDLESFGGPRPLLVNQIWSTLALAWAAVILVMAIVVARRRSISRPAFSPTSAVLELEAPPAPRARARVAAATLAALLGAALFVNGSWVFRHLNAVRPLVKGKMAPEFSLPRADGQPGRISLHAFAGKVVLLDFWATWCGPCVQMIPTLHGLYEEWRSRGVEFVGINSDGGGATPAEVAAFLREHPADYPMAIDTGGEVGGLYKVVALPHMVLVGRDGAILRTFWGVTARTELGEAITAALR